MATHCSILIWKIPWTEEPGGLQSTGPQKAGQEMSRVQQLGQLGYLHSPEMTFT